MQNEAVTHQSPTLTLTLDRLLLRLQVSVQKSFDRDDVGYITHIIPPREIVREDSTVSWLTIDTRKTIGVGVTERLYLFGYNNEEIVPPHEIDSFKVGARQRR